MKKSAMVLVCVLFLAGCGGSNEAKTDFQGVKAEKDYIAQGMKYLGQSDVANAIRSFDMAIKENPAKVENYLVLGQVYLRLKEYGRAADTFTGALRAQPNNGEVHYLIALSRALDGKRDLAIEAAQKSVEIFVKDKNEERFKQSVALLRSLSGTSEELTQTAENAKKTAEEAVQNIP